MSQSHDHDVKDTTSNALHVRDKGDFIDRAEETLHSVVNGMRRVLHSGSDIVANVADSGVKQGARLSRQGADYVERRRQEKNAQKEVKNN